MGVDLIDYTYLQKRGLIKKSEDLKSGVKMTNDGFLDLSNVTPSNEININANNLNNNNSTSEPTANPLSFFDNISSNATTNTETTSFYPSTPSSLNNSNDNLELNGLKLKMDDLEFKLSGLLEKIEQISSRLLEFERNTGR